MSKADRNKHLAKRSSNLRSSWLKRADKAGTRRSEVPDREMVEAWLLREFADDYAICKYTGSRILWSTDWEVDHAMPTSRGGIFHLTNAVICSRRVNAVKGALTDVEFRDLIRLVGGWPVRVRMEFYGRLMSAGRKYR